ncbi:MULTISPECIES: hypothetical protein [Mammaliicoccus]|uniref:hypothetical protein n=1 Tax=Mammaliicoccus TaxID=2803850 RepID=UPI00194DF458|nr:MULTISPECIES: hypothetical protein [Mammaliicoccus]MCD8760739.1 hypothetical protein [Mammaliicoccus sciuri]
MTIFFNELKVNEHNLFGRFELVEFQGKDYLIVADNRQKDLFDNFINNVTEITRFINEKGNMLSNLYDGKAVNFVNLEIGKDNELLIEIKKSDFKATRNFGS